MTASRALRQVLYTFLLVVWLRGCTTWLDPFVNGQTANPTIAVDASPKIQLATFGGSGSVWIRVTVPRDARNRVVCVVLDGPMSRVSCWEQSGSGAAYRKEFGYRSLPAGEYLVVGELQWLDEEKGERKTTYARDTFVIRSGE